MEANGLKIRERRLTAGLTQAELARQARVDPADLSRVEGGKKKGLHPDALKRVAAALGIDTAEISPELARLRAELNQVA